MSDHDNVQADLPNLVGDVAALQALLDTLGERGGDVLLELSKVVGVDLVGEAEGGIDDFRVDVDDEVLGDGAGTGVFRVETGDGDGGGTVQVLLEVDAALREDGALIFGQGGVELGDEAVLEHESREHLGVGDESQELGRTRVEVGSVQSTGVEEDACCGDTGAGEDGEVGSLSKIDLATCSGGNGGVGGRVEVELEVDGTTGELRLEVGEASDSVGRRQQLGNKTRRSGRVGGHSYWGTG